MKNRANLIEETPKPVCPKCGKKLKGQKGLKMHLKQVHEEERK